MGMENIDAQYITLKCIPPMCYVFKMPFYSWVHAHTTISSSRGCTADNNSGTQE